MKSQYDVREVTLSETTKLSNVTQQIFFFFFFISPIILIKSKWSDGSSKSVIHTLVTLRVVYIANM